MIKQLLHAIQDAALPTLLTFLSLGALGGLIVGIWLSLWPTQFFAVTSRLNQWYSARRALKIWETPFHWERFFYRHHRLFGVAILLATGWTLYYFVWVYSAERVYQVLGLGGVAAATDPWLGLLEGVIWVIRIASVLALLAGGVVLLRPSLLRRFEDTANGWFSTRQMIRPLERSYPMTDSYAARHPRLAGILISAICVYALASLALMLTGALGHL
jgi:hypothetical protein